MLDSEAVHLHVLLDCGYSLLASVGGGDWQTQSGPWRYAAETWQAQFEEARKRLSTMDGPAAVAAVRQLPYEVWELVEAADRTVNEWPKADDKGRDQILHGLADAAKAVRNRAQPR